VNQRAWFRVFIALAVVVGIGILAAACTGGGSGGEDHTVVFSADGTPLTTNVNVNGVAPTIDTQIVEPPSHPHGSIYHEWGATNVPLPWSKTTKVSSQAAAITLEVEGPNADNAKSDEFFTCSIKEDGRKVASASGDDYCGAHANFSP
jgi:hypothetical protein